MLEANRLLADCTIIAANARSASRKLAAVATEKKDQWLLECAMALREDQASVLNANRRDLAAAPDFGLTAAQTDRLRLDGERIESIAAGLEQIAELPDPNGKTLETVDRPNGLRIVKRQVPLGVVFFIYESRPNVTADAAAICVKSGNAVILRGGKEAAHSSQAIVSVVQSVATRLGLPDHAVQLVGTSDRAAVGHFLMLDEYIDLAIPRGGEGLIRRVTDEATMPVLKHFSGNCHIYVDRSADQEMAKSIVLNAKCQRMGVCNAAESLLIHADIAETFLPALAAALVESGVEIRGDEEVCRIFPEAVAASNADWYTEYLGPIISVAIVKDLDMAIDHINRYGSGHTDAIVAASDAAINAFATRVDSAAIMVNASTRFHDGGEFGLGAEIGISTDKFHARGPCGLNELMTYKYVVHGSGQIRS